MTLAMFALANLAVLRARWQAQPAEPEPLTRRESATEVAKGALSAAGRLERGPPPLDRARDSACVLGGRSGGLSRGDQLRVRVVALATTPPGAGQALPLPAPPACCMT